MTPQPGRSVWSASGRPAVRSGRGDRSAPHLVAPLFSQEVKRRVIVRATRMYASTCILRSAHWVPPFAERQSKSTGLPPGHLKYFNQLYATTAVLPLTPSLST